LNILILHINHLMIHVFVNHILSVIFAIKNISILIQFIVHFVKNVLLIIYIITVMIVTNASL
jgi:hypothetical protein